MDKDRLAAFVDGELSPEDAAAVVMHLADHPQDQAYVDDLIAANEALAMAFSAPLHEPVPEAIRAAIMGGTAPATERKGRVLPFRPRAGRTVWAGAALALAASLAAVSLLIPGGPPPPGGSSLTLGPIAAGSDLARAVTALPALTPEMLTGGQEVMILATVQTADGRFCREVEIIDRTAERLDLGIACTAGNGWTVEIALQESLRSDGDSIEPASGGPAGTLTRFLDSLGAGPALDPGAELSAIADGWAR